MKKGRRLLLLVLATVVILGCALMQGTPMPEPVQTQATVEIPVTEAAIPTTSTSVAVLPTATLTTEEARISLAIDELHLLVTDPEGIEVLEELITANGGVVELTAMEAWPEVATRIMEDEVTYSEFENVWCWHNIESVPRAEALLRKQTLYQVLVVFGDYSSWSWEGITDEELLPANTQAICLAPLPEVFPTATPIG